jgi:hypothetical protein
MALPSFAQLGLLEYSFDGQPTLAGSPATSIDLGLLEYSFDGQPFVANNGVATVVSTVSSSGDLAMFLDTAEMEVEITATELLFLGDDLSTNPSYAVEAPIFLDSAEFEITLTIEELLFTSDDGSTATSTDPSIIDFYASTKIIIYQAEDSTMSTRLGIAANSDSTYSNNIFVKPDILLPVSSPTATGNPFTPSVYIDGAVIFENPATQLSSSVYSGGGNYIVFGSNVIEADSISYGLCDLINWNINLALPTGTFQVTSKVPIGSAGSGINLFGVNGVITFAKTIKSDSTGKAYVVEGIFGPRNMDKQFQLVARVPSFMPNSRGLLGTQAVQVPPSSQWSTVQSAAQAVCEAANIDLFWLAKDAPLTEVFIQSGQTCLGALQSLASRVGAIVGNLGTGFFVAEPYQGYGTSGISFNCKLVQAAEYGSIADITNPLIILPIEGTIGENNTLLDPTYGVLPIKGLPELLQEATASITKRTEIFQTRNTFSAGSPAVYRKLPAEASGLWMQIYVTDPTVTGTAVTTDPNEWFEFTGSTVFMDDKTRSIVINESLFPGTLSDGEFTLSVAYSRNSAGQARVFSQGLDEANVESRSIGIDALHNFKAVKTGTGSVTGVFFGCLPQPGFVTSLGVGDGIVLNGLVESISYTWPGILTAQISMYEKLDMIKPIGSLDAASIEIASQGG